MSNPDLIALLPLEPPPAPPPAPWAAYSLLLAGFLLLLVLLWWWRRPIQRQRRHLRALEQQLQRPGCDTRAIATQLDHLLSDAMAGWDEAPGRLPAANWQSLRDELQQARFARLPPQVDNLTALLPVIRRLLDGRHATA